MFHRAKDCLKHEKINALVKEIEEEFLKPLEAKVVAVHMNMLQLQSNTEVKVNEETMNEEMLESMLRGETYQKGLIYAIVRLTE